MQKAAFEASIGGAIGPALGGFLLALFSYQITGAATGALSVSATCTYIL